VVAALLHFFFLAVFVFMLMEGVELYILLVRVFNVGGSRAKWYIIAGWGEFGCN
jgi:latrophilin 3